MNKFTREEQQSAEATDAIVRFKRHGILAIWGGGSHGQRDQFRKGHGFWLYQTTIREIDKYEAAKGFCEIPGRSIENNGFRSGNTHFWLYKDAIYFLENSYEKKAA